MKRREFLQAAAAMPALAVMPSAVRETVAAELGEVIAGRAAGRKIRMKGWRVRPTIVLARDAGSDYDREAREALLLRVWERPAGLLAARSVKGAART